MPLPLAPFDAPESPRTLPAGQFGGTGMNHGYQHVVDQIDDVALLSEAV